MSFEEKLGLTMMMELIEGELEERKVGVERRQKDSEETMEKVTDDERRVRNDRRGLDA